MKVEQVLENPPLDIALSPHFRMRLALSVYGLSHSARLTLICIAEAANFNKFDGACWYAQDTIAAETGLTRETVSRAYKELIFRGLIDHTPQSKFPGYGGKKPGVSKSRKVYLNIEAMIKQADPPNGEWFAHQYKQKLQLDRGMNKRRRPAGGSKTHETGHLEPEGLESEPATPDITPAVPVEPVGVIPVADRLTKTSEGEPNPWHDSNDPEAERARQMAALAAYRGAD